MSVTQHDNKLIHCYHKCELMLDLHVVCTILKRTSEITRFMWFNYVLSRSQQPSKDGL